MYTRSWQLDTIAPSDEIDLTYSVNYATSTTPGLYHNVARVSGHMGDPNPALGYAMPDVTADGDVEFVANGMVLGDSTSTLPSIATSSVMLNSKNASSTPAGPCTPLITVYLRPGSGNPSEVKKLQGFLNTQGASLPLTGYFGPLTLKAVKNFQNTYASDVLAPVGLSQPSGLVYSMTQRKINSLVCGGTPLDISAAPGLGGRIGRHQRDLRHVCAEARQNAHARVGLAHVGPDTAATTYAAGQPLHLVPAPHIALWFVSCAPSARQ